MKFYKEVETYFLETRGRLFGLSSYNLISPKDIQAIKKWESSGIPLKIINEGIETSLKKYLLNYPYRRDDPPSLLYCQAAIFKLWRDYKEASIGKKADTNKETDNPDYLNKIIEFNLNILRESRNKIDKIIPMEKSNNLISIIDETITILNENQKSIGKTMLISQKIKNILEEFRTSFVLEMKKNLPYSSIKAVLKETKNELKEYKMSPGIYRNSRNIILEDKIFDSAGLSDIKIP